MARKHNSKKDTQAKARAKAAASAAKGWVQQRAAEEQAKMDNGAVKDVTKDPAFAADAGPARSKSIEADRAGVVASRGTVSRDKAEASKPTPAVTATARVASKPAKGTRAPRKTARKGNKAGTVKTGV